MQTDVGAVLKNRDEECSSTQAAWSRASVDPQILNAGINPTML